MDYPEFYDEVPRVHLHDPLAEFLGATNDGVIAYGYLDAVKLAGHSCPTVASAYWLTVLALRALYGNQIACRGGIHVAFREARDEGVTGVVANVISLLTGAAPETGFKGLAGRFERRGLLGFQTDLPLDIRYTRRDTGASVDAAAHVRQVPADPAMPALMQRCLAQQASPDEARRFAILWQERVRRLLLEHGDDPTVFIVRPVA